MHITVNYSTKEVIDMVEAGVCTPQILYLNARIQAYQKECEQEIRIWLDKMNTEKELTDISHKMRCIEDNVPKVIRIYLQRIVLKQSYNVLMKGKNNYKTITDIGIVVEKEGITEKYEGWLNVWKKQSEKLKELDISVFETHAHYQLPVYSKVREPLLHCLAEANIKKIIIPAISFESNLKMKEWYDSAQYNKFVYYSFGLHPKCISKNWEQEWSEKRWTWFEKILLDHKCVAVGEVGLDFSVDPDEEILKLQEKAFRSFIQRANDYKKPVIIHLRPLDIWDDVLRKDIASTLVDKLKKTAFDVLDKFSIQNGAVLHCFTGNFEDMKNFTKVGVTHFGIGPKVFYNRQLQEAVSRMDERQLVIETDAPFLKLESGSIPNTSLVLFEVAEKIAELRGVSVEHILKATYTNALELFSGCN